MDATTQKTEPRQIQSRVGKRPIDVPKGITVALKDGTIRVEGPKGQLSRAVPAGVDVKIDGPKISVTSSLGRRVASRRQGRIRALIATIVKGTSEGYTKTLELRVTGYRAE